MAWKTQSRSMFKVKVDKQTLSHRCQTAGKVSGGPAEAECVEPSWFPTHAGSSAASFSLLKYFQCCSPRRCHPQVRGSAEFTFFFVRYFHHHHHHDLKARFKYVRDRRSAHCTQGPSTCRPVLGAIVKEATVKPERSGRLRGYKLTVTRVNPQNPTFYLLFDTPQMNLHN